MLGANYLISRYVYKSFKSLQQDLDGVGMSNLSGRVRVSTGTPSCGRVEASPARVSARLLPSPTVGGQSGRFSGVLGGPSILLPLGAN